MFKLTARIVFGLLVVLASQIVQAAVGNSNGKFVEIGQNWVDLRSQFGYKLCNHFR